MLEQVLMFLDKMAVKNIEDDLKSVENISEINTIIQNGLFQFRQI